MYKNRILVVDDDKEVCDMIKEMLELKGYDTTVALNGEEGIKKAVEYQPDLVLLDIKMPGIDGFEVLHKLKHNSKTEEIPIIIVSAYRDTENIFKARELRAEDFIAKPFSTQELFKIVGRCLSLFRSRQIIQLDPRLASKIKNKLTSVNSVLELLSKGEDVPKELIEKARGELEDLTKILNQNT